MKNIKLIIEYDGSLFHGYQIQEGLRTVEGELKEALEEATNEEIDIISAGRTDRGVHALGHVVNFRTSRDIPAENYKRLMDFLLPDDISIKDSYEVDYEFHARFDARWRKYRYVVYNRKLPNAVVRNYSYFFPYELDYDLMDRAREKFIGKKDFSSFKLAEDVRVNPVREIKSLDLSRQGNFLVFDIVGNAFLHNMIRIIVGTILQIGQGKIELEDLDRIIEAKDRQEAGITAGAQGLYLMDIIY